MQKYNAYEQMVCKYLKNYSNFKHQIASIDIEIEGINSQIETLGGLKATTYDKVIVSGGEPNSSVERAIEQKEKLEARLLILAADRQRIATLIHRIDAALETLNDSDREIVQMKHMNGYNWIYITQKLPYSERSCQRREREAVGQIAAILFPESAIGQRTNFLFVDGSFS